MSTVIHGKLVKFAKSADGLFFYETKQLLNLSRQRRHRSGEIEFDILADMTDDLIELAG